MKRAALVVSIGVTMACMSGGAFADADIGLYLGFPVPVYQAPPPAVYVPPQIIYETPPPYYYDYGYRDEDRGRWWHEHHRHGEREHHDEGDEN